jgi:hypothetical protein
MKIVYVTSSLPHGKKRASIIPEVSEPNRGGQDVLTVSAYPRGAVLRGDVKPLLSDVVSRPLLSVDLAGVPGDRSGRTLRRRQRPWAGCCLEAAAPVDFFASW